MSEVDVLIRVATDLFTKECPPEVVAKAEESGWAPGLWHELESTGLSMVGLEASRTEALAVVKVAAAFAAPIPLAETVLACLVSPEEVTSGPHTVGAGGRASYGRIAVKILGADRFTLEPDVNYAGEPYDRVSPAGYGRMLLDGALVRSVQMAGALETVLALTVTYAQDRRQFGVPLATFQAVQQQLALLAGEVVAAVAAADRAAEFPTELNIAAAKVRCGEAAGFGSSLAHQVHGAIGFTEEHRLQQYTRRLWSWRDDFGTESEWAVYIGRLASAMGAAAFWSATG
jgi:acyl-CoA dehydrogenase